ncbi:MAG: helicase-related protein [bacterium]
MNDNRTIFANQVVQDFISKITGANVTRLSGNDPEEMFYVGKLSSIDEDQDYRSSMVIIKQMGIDFFINKEDIEETILEIQPSGEFYYRVLPTLDEQRKELKDKLRLMYDEEFNDFSDIKDKFESMIEKNANEEEESKILANLDKNSLAKVYEKISINKSNYKIQVNLNEILNRESDAGMYSANEKLTIALDQDILEIWQKPTTYKTIRDRLRYGDIKDEYSFQDFFDRNAKNETPKPRWEIDIRVTLKLLKNDFYRVSVDLINETQGTEISKYKKNKAYSDVLFNSGLEVKLDGTKFRDIEMNYFADDYKYDKTQKGIGNNCTIEFIEEKNMIRTTNIPIFHQKRLKTREDLVVKFDDLINSPFKSLNNVYEKMLKEKEKWDKEYENQKPSLTNKARVQFKEEIKGFEFEIKRFKYGIDQLKYRDFAKQAFIYMNKTFKKSSDYDSWRLFQIVFIVSLIPDIIVTEYGEEEIDKSFIDKVDLLYFPTGGGKTEAFIGITIFTLFFDRFRGKKVGISSFIKYPLRLLSVQQVDRIVNIIAVAELLRREDEFLEGDVFSLGYFVGSGNTPNRIKKQKASDLKLRSQEYLNDKNRIIDTCPFCKKKSVNIVYDKSKNQLKHHCTNEVCPSGGDLPLYIVDYEIYRYLPSVIISTIDRIASIGQQPNFRNILGAAKHKCPVHGYTGKTKCIEKEVCNVDISSFEEINLKDPAPTLLIQDEVHLIRESLGTFDAHYETLFQHMISEINNKKKMKIIGATATISDYKAQIRHLYNLDAIRFPSASPFVDKDFYSYIDKNDLNRIILGYAPYGQAIINSVVYSMKYLREVIWDYYNDISKLKAIPGINIKDDSEALDIIKDYWIFLEYNNVKLDSNKVINALNDPINTELALNNKTPFMVRKMTGDDSFQDVRQILAEVEQLTTGDIFSAMNLIAATSMISHGVDANKFNIMFFFGMPGNTAEYIQAYSRAGRKYPGIIIDIIRPTRERDQSYLKNFVKFHEYKEILVEPVPINRWSYKAIYKTFAGILSAFLMNYYDNTLQYKYGNIYGMHILKKVVEDNAINLDELKEHIKKAYVCIVDGSIEDIAKRYNEFIDKKIDHFFDELKVHSFGGNYMFITKGIPQVDKELFEPMRSLRDTDKTVQIEMR